MSQHIMGATLEERSKDYAFSEKIRQAFYTDAGTAKRKKHAIRFLAVTLLLVLIFATLNWGLITGWGNVKIRRLTLAGTNGHQFSALLYVPQNATDVTPAPAVINFHGNAGNARNHESWAVEFARRGFVVLSVDQFGAGDSEQFLDTWSLGGNCLTEVGEEYFQYLKTLTFVDQSNVLSAGHSMGCTPAEGLGAKYGAKAILAASPATSVTEAYLPYWDNYQGGLLTVTGDVETTPEQYIEENLPLLQKCSGYETVDSMELDTLYGSFEESNPFYATLDTERIHEAAFVSQETIGKLIWFAQESVENVPNFIDASNQIWMYKDYIGLLGIFAFGAFICAVAIFLINFVPAFSVVCQPMPRNIGLRRGGFAISAICGILFPWLVLKTGTFGLLTPKNKNNISLCKAV